jgi:hypothetical protein
MSDTETVDTSAFRLSGTFYGHDMPTYQDFANLDRVHDEVLFLYSPDNRLQNYFEIAAKLNLSRVGIPDVHTYLEYKDDAGSVTEYTRGNIVTRFSEAFGTPSDSTACLFTEQDREEDSISVVYSFEAESEYKKNSNFVEELQLLETHTLQEGGMANILDIVVKNFNYNETFAGAIGSPKSKVDMQYSPCTLALVDKDFLNVGGNTSYGFPVYDVIQNLIAQYGGYTMEAKRNSLYIDASKGMPNQVNTYVHLFGDIYISFVPMIKEAANKHYMSNKYHNPVSILNIMMETELHPEDMDRYKYFYNKPVAEPDVIVKLSIAQLTETHPILSIPNQVIQSFGDLYENVNTVNATVNMVASTKSTDLYYIDEYLLFDFKSPLKLEGKFGPIIKLERVKFEIYAMQTSGISHISVYPVKQSSGADKMIYAEGGVLDNYKYLVETSGILSIFSSVATSSGLYWIDHSKRTINSITELNKSKISGIDRLIDSVLKLEYASRDVSDVNRTMLYTDSENYLVYFSLGGGTPAVVYNEAVSDFTHRRTFNQTYFIDFASRLMSVTKNSIWEMNTNDTPQYFSDAKGFYFTNPYIEVLTDPVPGYEKVFDAIEVESPNESNTLFDSFAVTLDYNYIAEDNSVEWKGKYETQNAHLPRINGTRGRLRGHSIRLRMTETLGNVIDIIKFYLKFTIKK